MGEAIKAYQDPNSSQFYLDRGNDRPAPRTDMPTTLVPSISRVAIGSIEAVQDQINSETPNPSPTAEGVDRPEVDPQYL